MNTTKLAEELGINYQTVSRAVRAVLKAEGKWEPNPGAGKGGLEYTPELESKVRAHLSSLHKSKKVELIKSTAEQRREWNETWKAAFLKAEPSKWAAFAVVVASIEHTKVSGWVSRRNGKKSIGGMTLSFALKAGADLDENGIVKFFGGFTEWLIDQGFSETDLPK